MQTLPRHIDSILAALMTASRFAISIGGAAILVSAFLISADVFLRRFFGVSTWGSDELSYYALAISTSWALGYTMLVKAHIRIDLISSNVGVPLRAVFDIVALLGMGFLAFIGCYAVFEVFRRSFTRGSISITTLETPLWIPQGLFLLGFVFFAIVTVVILLRVVAALVIERSLETVERVAGVLTVEDETEEAIAGAEAAQGNQH